MSTLERAGLTLLLKDLSISTPTLEGVQATILSNPLDLCRTTLAELLASIVECDVQTAFRSIQWPNNIFNGDLSVTIPRLCPGRKPAEVSSQLVDKVRLFPAGD
jgi:arginyl-tRNA synthetase